METNNEKEGANGYRIGRLTVLELMTVLAVLGILITWILRRFFTS
jgi:Tfp pilus assembly protein PilE